MELSMDLWHSNNMKVILALWALNCCLCSSFLYWFFPYSSQSSQPILKNLSEKHDKTSINLTNIFDHILTTFSIFLSLIFPFICLDASVYILMTYKWSKIRAWFAFWLNIYKIQPSKYIVKNRNSIFLYSTLVF